MNNAGDSGALSEPQPVKGMIFREVEPTYDYNFHKAPQKQYIILLDGEIESETSLGETRKINAGEILLVEDTTGKGHRTRVRYCCRCCIKFCCCDNWERIVFFGDRNS